MKLPLAIIFIMCELLSPCIAAFADDLSTTGDCSPAILHSTIDGSVDVNCSVGQQQIVMIAQSLEVIAKNQHLTQAQLHRLFDAVNTLLRALLFKDNRLIHDVSKANTGIKHLSEIMSDLKAGPIGSVETNSGAVSSQDQSGGVTAGTYVLNQNTLPNRSQFTTPLTAFYAQGVGIKSAMSVAMTDVDIESAAKAAAKWRLAANAWILNNMGPAAQALFVDNSNTLSFDFGSPSQASAANVQVRADYLSGFNVWLPNLKLLIASHDYDPPKQ